MKIIDTLPPEVAAAGKRTKWAPIMKAIADGKIAVFTPEEFPSGGAKAMRVALYTAASRAGISITTILSEEDGCIYAYLKDEETAGS